MPRLSPAVLPRVARAALAIVLLASLPAVATSQGRLPAPASLTDAEFWEFFTRMSEPGGYFLSENFVSNEVSFQEVIPTLQKTLTPDGVYLGVGPEQNFTYIANLNPRMAVIFDIRRQNAMQHLMYKALFEMSSTRSEFVARLFSLPAVARIPADLPVAGLFDSAAVAVKSDSAYAANLAAIRDQLMKRHGFPLTADDLASIEHVYQVFFSAGPGVNYGYRSGSTGFSRSSYPTYGMLQGATNADSIQMAFLATESHYQAVRRMHLKNLIIPVVGDFAGPRAIRQVGEYLRKRNLTVTAFYVSNVEQYLFGDRRASDRFYGNVATLPLDSTSMFIRSVPRSNGPMMRFGSGSATTSSFSVFIMRDSGGTRITRTVRDSAGVALMSVTRDSAGVPVNSTPDSSLRAALARDSVLLSTLQALSRSRDSAQWQVIAGPPSIAMMGGLLTSGLAPMQKTVGAHIKGELKSYTDVIGMTRTSDWKEP